MTQKPLALSCYKQSSQEQESYIECFEKQVNKNSQFYCVDSIKTQKNTNKVHALARQHIPKHLKALKDFSQKSICKK